MTVLYNYYEAQKHLCILCRNKKLYYDSGHRGHSHDGIAGIIQQFEL
jgi:hypothetical protein